MHEQIRLLESADEVAIAGSIYSIVRTVGQAFGETVDTYLSAKEPRWFAILKQVRRDQKLPTYDDFHDLRFILKESVAGDGVVELGIPHFDDLWRQEAIRIRRLLNSWSHNSLEPNLATFRELVGGLCDLAQRSGLSIADDLRRAVDRAIAIDSGKFATKNAVQLVESLPEVEKLKAKRRAIEARPPVGSEWVGELGKRKIFVSRQLQDVTENGVSIKTQLGNDPVTTLQDWLRYFPEPKGGEARVADDGAVMAFKRGQAYLIGWLGDEPPRASALQGFALPHEYMFTGSDVRDLVSGRLLSAVAREKSKRLISDLASSLESGAFFRATAYGELFVDRDFGDQQILASVNKDTWFPSHLPEMD